jgi:hypothetical protein
MINLNDIKFEIDTWYRGMKKISIKSQTSNTIKFSNNDIIKLNDNEIYLNNKLICNDEITNNQLIQLYTKDLKKRGYKFI